jgi:hypothetical protein
MSDPLEEHRAFFGDGDENRILDELAVCGVKRVDLLAIAERLRIGRERYGVLCLATDTRDWKKEAREEWLDMQVYRACARVSCDKGHRFVTFAATPVCPECWMPPVETP